MTCYIQLLHQTQIIKKNDYHDFHRTVHRKTYVIFGHTPKGTGPSLANPNSNTFCLRYGSGMASISAVKHLPLVTFWRRIVTYAKIVFKQIFFCKFLIVHVLFIQTIKSRKLMCIFPQTREFSLLELRNYFCWRRQTSIYVVGD